MAASVERPDRTKVVPNIEKLDTAKPPSTRSLLARLGSAAVLIPVVLSAVHYGGRWFSAVVAFACIVMIFEWTRMVERKECSASFYVLSFGATAAMFAAPSGAFVLAYSLCAASGALAFILAKRGGGLGLWPALAAIYILAPSVALMWLRLDADHGRALTFMLFFIVWAADTGAFITGKLIGGPKINYALSPSKTWAGIGGGVIGGSIIGGLTAVYAFGLAEAAIFLVIGGVLGAASVAGDLAESAAKRNFGLKDISGFIPGHGGALDRMDGMIFSTVAMTSGYFIYMIAGKGQG